MFARLKSVEHDGAYFRRVLKLPRPSVEFSLAQEESRRASSDLRRLGEHRENLKVERTIDNPGKERMPDATYRATLDRLEAEILAAQARDRDARAEFDLQRGAYSEHVRTALAADLNALGAEINERLGQVFELLDIASILSAKAREARVELPALISGAEAAAQTLRVAVDSSIAKITRGARA